MVDFLTIFLHVSCLFTILNKQFAHVMGSKCNSCEGTFYGRATITLEIGRIRGVNISVRLGYSGVPSDLDFDTFQCLQ